MSQHSTYSVLTPANLREQAYRAREYARYLTGDPAADRLRHFAGELDARADAMDEPTVKVVPGSCRVVGRGASDGTLIAGGCCAASGRTQANGPGMPGPLPQRNRERSDATACLARMA
jgi:hypothetical protein